MFPFIKANIDIIQTLTPNREFFEIYPWDAYNMLNSIARLHERTDKLVRNDTNKSGEEDQNDSEYSVNSLFPDDKQMASLYNRLKGLILSIDNSLEESPRKNYVTFKYKKKNVVSLWPKSGWIEVVLNAKIGSIKDVNDMIYDISNRKWTSEQYAFKYYSDTDDSDVKNLLQQTYDLKNK